MKKFVFSENELQELEALEVRGGDRADPMAQEGCINNVEGCGYNADQMRCENSVLGCGNKPTVPTEPTQNPCVTLNSCTIKPIEVDCPK